ncbi:hypothetical protein GCM10010129_46650 [Streptomyces fumigatiscleroticus]|nr:hypothetical protein GCM10010129_46650 [Streptomyces fumigatiscleroticus]
MSDDAQTPAADARTPDAPDAPDGRAAAGPVPGGDGRPAAWPPAAGDDVPTDLWAPPGDTPPAPGGPGTTVASSDGPAAWPPPSLHDQQTVTSTPSEDTGTPPSPAPGATTTSPPWATPSGPGDGAGGGTGGPFAPGDPFAPPAAASGPADPFAPPVAAASPAHAPVPPPPISPDGPGQVPYGYPGGYGYPGPPGYGGLHAQGYHGWPGMMPMPSNGMGTAALVLGIVAAVVFCLWPLAILLGILGVIFGAVGRGKARRGEATNGGQALAGIICGSVGIAVGIVFGLLVLFTA